METSRSSAEYRNKSELYICYKVEVWEEQGAKQTTTWTPLKEYE